MMHNRVCGIQRRVGTGVRLRRGSRPSGIQVLAAHRIIGVCLALGIALAGSVLGGCGSEPDAGADRDTARSHPWQTQTDALERAQQLERTMLEANRKRQDAIDQATR